jgi:acyl-CoA thioesterase
MGLDEDTALRPAGAGEYEGSIVEHWWTPRGPLGGYVMAIVHRGMELAVDDRGRQPRSLNVYFLRPPHAGPITVRPVVERVGRSLTTATARLEQDGKLIALGVGAFSSAWPGPELSEAPMPDVEPPGERATTRGNVPGAEQPPFMGRLTMQRRFGEPAFSGAEHALTGGWLGLLEERPVDAVTVLVLADAWYPAPWPRLKALAPAPTIEMSVMFRAPLPLSDSLLLGKFHSRLVRDGFFDEQGELWAPDGTLVAQSRQLALLIGADA